MIKQFVALLFVWIVFANVACEKNGVIRIGFYNVENLFDTEDDPIKIDEYYTPSSPIKWDETKYQTKIDNLGKVIRELCFDSHPHILGLCEIENRTVLEDLVSHSNLHDFQYQIIHFESPDARGIDNALLYDAKEYTVFESGVQRVDLNAFEETTRDILWSKGILSNGDTLICFVNHWPSRREGKAQSEPKRIQAAKTLKALVNNMETEHPSAAVVVMGDFNDEPSDSSIRDFLGAKKKPKKGELMNMMAGMHEKGKGSYNFRGNWNMLDQIIVNDKLNDNRDSEVIRKATGIKEGEWLIQKDEKYYGYPLRSFGGQKYLAGYSDHFAVYTAIKLR